MKNLFYPGLLIILVCSLFYSCNKNTDLEEKSKESLSDLKVLNLKTHKLLENIINNKISTKSSSAEYSSEKDEKELENSITSFLEKYKDVLCSSNYYKTNISKDSALTLKSNPDAFLEFIKKNGTSEYYNIMKDAILNSKLITLSNDEIINNNKMTINEKIALLLEKSVDDISEKKDETKSVSSCYSGFKSARTGCGIWYAIECSVSLAGGAGILTAVGVALATRSLNNCLNDAREDYINCLE